MTLHVFVEGPSERAFFDRWCTRLVPNSSIRVHPHQGKGSLPKNIDARPDPKRRGLLDQLPAKLRGLDAAVDPAVDAVFVLVDADDDEVDSLLRSISTVTARCAPRLRVAVSIAVEEMEAFYLGDLRALRQAFPAADMVTARAYLPDSIDGTWELFGRIVHDGGGNKVAWAEAMGPRVTIRAAESRSPSFRLMVERILALEHRAPGSAVPSQRRRFRHVAKAPRR